MRLDQKIKVGNRYHKLNCSCVICKKIIYKGENNPNWKGDKVSYVGLHHYIERNLGTSQKCSNCGTTSAKKYEWANISGLYKRDFKDWKRVCTKCHRKIDAESRPKGENHVSSKLKTKDVLEIRRLYKRNEYIASRLAKEFKVGATTIQRIINKKTWKHILGE